MKALNHKDRLIVYCYSFTPDGDCLWLAGDSPIRGNRAQVSLVEVDGGRIGPLFDSSLINRQAWGALDVTLDNSDRGRVKLSGPFA